MDVVVAVAVAVGAAAGVGVGVARGVGVGADAAGVGVGEGVTETGVTAWEVGVAVGLGARDGIVTVVLSLPPNEQATLRSATKAAKKLCFIDVCMFGGALYTLIELVHGGFNTAADNPSHGFSGTGECFPNYFRFLRGEAPKHEIYRVLLDGLPYTNAQPGEVQTSQFIDDGVGAVVARGTAARSNADLPNRQVSFIVDGKQVGRR